MKTTDRFLVGIVVGLVLLVAVAVLMARRAPTPTYRPEAEPVDTAYNYILAVAQDDDERVYSYLASAAPGRPASLTEFRADKMRCSWCFRSGSDVPKVEVTQDWQTGDDAGVKVNLTYFQEGGLFESPERREQFSMILRREGGAWKIARSEQYWYPCWHDVSACEKTDPRYRDVPPRTPTP